MKEFDARWIGCAGVNVPDDVGQRALTKALAEKVRKSSLELEVAIKQKKLKQMSSIILDHIIGFRCLSFASPPQIHKQII